MTQLASLLAVATVFIDLWTPFYSRGGGGGGAYVPMQELELKMQGGGLMRKGGGVIAGFYGILYIPYPRERGPMGGAPYIGPRLGDGPHTRKRAQVSYPRYLHNLNSSSGYY